MATLDQNIWINGGTGLAEDGSTVISEGGRSTTVTADFTGNWDETQGGYNVADLGQFGVSTGIVADYSFSNPVENLTFEFQHVNGDEVSYDDMWTIRAYDENGTLIDPALITAAISGLNQDVVYTNGDNSVTIESEGSTANNVTFNYSGLISRIELTFDNGPDAPSTGGSGISDFTFDIPVPDTDGDGVADDVDIDDDNDGILDTEEGLSSTNPGTITVTFDGDEYSNTESYWELRDASGTVIASDTTHSTAVEITNVSVTDLGNYTFTVTDTYGDGIMGPSDPASYQVAIDGVTVIDSGPSPNFGSSIDHVFAVEATVTTRDTDGDGIADHLDLDSDDDGITDNVEAQSTEGYITPTGLDSDNDGLDNAYEGTGGLQPVDTDGDGTDDYIDTDSDGDGIIDSQETGYGVSQAAIDASGDADGDGIKDVVDDVSGWDVNDNDINGLGEYALADSDNDTAADGTDADGMVHNLDFRDATFNVPLDGTVEGTSGNDTIDSAYTGDFDGDRIDNADATIPGHAAEDDLVFGFSGDDTITSGTGADTVYGGYGDDSIDGGDGNDIIHGDDPNQQTATAQSEHLDWSAQGASGTDISDGFVQNTGTMDVRWSFTNDGSNTGVTTNSATQYVETGEPFATNSSLQLTGGAGPNVTAEMVFDAPTGSGLTDTASDITFRLNDVDFAGWQDIITVNAYDIDGNLIPVSLVAEDPANDVVTGNTVTANNTSDGQSDQVGSVLVTIPGPAHRVEIVYENGGTVGQALWVTDVHFETVPEVPTTDDDILIGGTGDDTLYGGLGNDSLNGGADDDVVYGGDGNDSLFGETGNDTLFGGEGDDYVDGDAGDDTLHGDGGNDTIVLDGGNDLAYGGTGNDDIYASDGDNTAFGGAGSDQVFMGTGNDTIDGGTEADTIYGGGGSDTIQLNNNFGSDTIVGGEDVGDTDTDTLDLSGVTDNLTVDLTSADPEAGTVSDGTDTATFSEIENIQLGAGQDTIVLADGSGSDRVEGFQAPTPDGDGTFTGVDMLDVTALTDGTRPVNVSDVTVTDDGSGNAVLTFPNGENITLVGISPVDADDPQYLNAIGIPMTDGIVEGTASGDLMIGSYSGDPDGDVIDGGDAHLPGETGDDDIVYGYGGNDYIQSGSGNDEAYGGTGNDSVVGGSGNDDLYGGDGNDSVYGGTGADTVSGDAGDDLLTGLAGADTLYGGTGNDEIRYAGGDTAEGGDGDDLFYADTVNFDGTTNTITGGEGAETSGDTLSTGPYSGSSTLDLTAGGTGADPESGTLTMGADSVTFSEIENFELGAGDDSAIGSSDNDSIDLGAGSDTINAGAGNDSISLGDNGAGGPDGDADVVVLEDGFGDDLITHFDAPTPNGDGTFTGIDTFDVTGLTNGVRPVNVNDVDVTDAGGGNTLLTFPNGESVLLAGIDNTVADDPFWLNAVGIPMSDGTVSGTAGDDTIDAAYIGDPDGDVVDGNDAILPGDTGNDDLIEAGAGNDTVFAGNGNDEVYGGTGDDTLDGGGGADSLHGEADDDDLSGHNGADTLFGGDGNDTLRGNAGDDTIFGGAGDDTIATGNFLGGTPDGSFSLNTVYGGSGNDDINASVGNDTVYGGDDADTIGGRAGEDDLYGDAGDDNLYGGLDNDTLSGGTGNDTLDGGAGDDTLYGGDDADYIFGGGNDVVVGGEGGDDNDTLFLGEFGTTITYGGGNNESGTVEFADGSILTFSEIETIVPCFTPGTLIRTAQGDRPVESLQAGDMILTRDAGFQPLAWTGKRHVTRAKLAEKPGLRPVLIRADALGPSQPNRDMMVSPQHRMLVSGGAVQLWMGVDEVLVKAKDMTHKPGIGQAEVAEVTYVHIMFEHHQIVLADGAWSESFQPGDMIVGNAEEEEMFEELIALFPELGTEQGRADYVAARLSAKHHEAQLIC